MSCRIRWRCVIRTQILTAALAGLLLFPASSSAWPKPPASWMNSTFITCVRIRESGNGRGSTNIYGILDGWRAAGGSGDAWHATRAEQDWRAYRLWLRYGVSPWRRWDGC